MMKKYFHSIIELKNTCNYEILHLYFLNLFDVDTLSYIYLTSECLYAVDRCGDIEHLYFIGGSYTYLIGSRPVLCLKFRKFSMAI